MPVPNIGFPEYLCSKNDFVRVVITNSSTGRPQVADFLGVPLLSALFVAIGHNSVTYLQMKYVAVATVLVEATLVTLFNIGLNYKPISKNGQFLLT